MLSIDQCRCAEMLLAQERKLVRGTADQFETQQSLMQVDPVSGYLTINC